MLDRFFLESLRYAPNNTKNLSRGLTEVRRRGASPRNAGEEFVMTAMPGTLPDLLDQLAAKLASDAARSSEQGLDPPVSLTRGRLLQTVGNLHLYEFFLSPDVEIGVDLSVTLLLGEEAEPTEGIVLSQEGERLILQTFDAIGEVVPSATMVPDVSGLALTTSGRLIEMSKTGGSYTLGPAERLLPVLEAGQAGYRALLETLTPTSVLTTLWHEEKNVFSWSPRITKVPTQSPSLSRAP